MRSHVRLYQAGPSAPRAHSPLGSRVLETPVSLHGDTVTSRVPVSGTERLPRSSQGGQASGTEHTDLTLREGRHREAGPWGQEPSDTADRGHEGVVPPAQREPSRGHFRHPERKPPPTRSQWNIPKSGATFLDNSPKFQKFRRQT